MSFPRSILLLITCLGWLGSVPPAPGEEMKGAAWWAVQPVTRPPVPALQTSGNPIDAFIVAKLAEKGLTPAPEADRRTLIRRLSV